MSQNKLEECARALICADYAGNGDFDEQQEAWLGTLWNSYRRYEYLNRVRAVIRCLMEPDDEMVESAVRFVSGDVTHIPRRVFRAMLQSVLDEGK